MKHTTLHSPLYTLLSTLYTLLSAHAAVPLSWTVETSRAQPATFEAYQGETLTFEAALQSHGKPLEAPLNYSFFWQTNGMGSTYWEAPCPTNYQLPDTNLLRATWSPTNDVGARAYNCFIGEPGTIYHAAFQLRLRPSPGATPNVLPLPQKVIDFAKVTVLNPPWSGGGGSVDTNAVRDIAREEIAPATNRLTQTLTDSTNRLTQTLTDSTNRLYKTLIDSMPTGDARPLPKYLHALDFADTYPEDAAWYYAQPQPYTSCSAVRDGNTLSRNYDWTFDDAAEFVLSVSGNADRFASVGVANVGTNLTEEIVTSGKWSRYYKCLPGHTVDGINEHGVVAEINVVDGPVSGWHTTGDLHPLAAVRWALDHATNAQHAAEYLAANIRFPSGWTQNFHYMIADETSTYIVENGKVSVPIDTSVNPRIVMTNYRVLDSLTYDPSFYSFDPDSAGVERLYLLYTNATASITNVWYTRAYSPETSWLSDFNGSETLMATSKVLWAQKPKEQHRGETLRSTTTTSDYDYTWWQTVHTSIYDITNRILRVSVQEIDDWYTFAVPSTGGTDEAKVREIAEAVVAPVAASVDGKVSKSGDTMTGGLTIGNTTLEEDELLAVDGEIRASGGFSQFANSWAGSPKLIWRGEYFEDEVSGIGGRVYIPYTDAPWIDAVKAGSVKGLALYSDIIGAWSDANFMDSAYSYIVWESSTLWTDPLWIISADGWLSGKHFLTSETDPTVALTNRTIYVHGDSIDVPTISATDPTFSNAVLAVGLNIDTNSVAVLNEIAATFGDFPITGTATTVGGLLAALAAAVAWLRKRAAHLDNSGFGDDDFATDLLGKQVAKAKLQTIEDEPTVTSGAVTLKDGAASTVAIGSLASLDITFDEARNGGLRLCELYITGVTAETIPDLTFDAETVSFVATGDSFPACEAGINYFVFAEVAANLWKVTRETLKSITTPTPVAAE